MGLQVRLQAHDFSKKFVDKLVTHPDWHEGNTQWEEAYALFNPALYSQMLDAMTRLSDHLRTVLPAHLNPTYCHEYLSLLHTKHGAVAQRLRDIFVLQQELSDLAKNPASGTRLKVWFDQTGKEIENEKNKIYDEPDFVKNQPPYRAAYKKAAAYDAQLEDAGRQSESALANFDAQERERSQKWVVDAFNPHRGTIEAIIQRFKMSTKQVTAQEGQVAATGIKLLTTDTCREGLFPLAGSTPTGRFDSKEILSICLTNPGNSDGVFQILTNGKKAFKVTPDEAKGFNAYISNTYTVQCTDPRYPDAAKIASILPKLTTPVRVDTAHALCVASTVINGRPIKAVYVFDHSNRLYDSAILEPAL